MTYEMKLRNKYIIDYDEETVEIVGTYGVLNEEGEFNHRVRHERKVSLLYFKNFCVICIKMKCGVFGNEDTKNEYGVRFYRETFDDRYFQTDDFEMALGEVYFMFEIISNRIDVRKFRAYRFDNYIIFQHPGNITVITDDSCLDIVVLATSTIMDLDFSLNGRDEIKYNKSIKLTNITSAFLDKSAYPYVNLCYRDCCIAFTLYTFRRLKELLRTIIYVYLEEI